jgi:hypothetical protein
MMNQKFNELSECLEAILSKDLGYEFLVNPYFRFSKASPEQMKPYFMVMRNVPRPVILVTILIQIPFYILKLLISLLLSVGFSYQYKIFNYKSYEQQILFLSHGTLGNLSDRIKDRFFDELPEIISKDRHIPCTVIYTNQNKLRYRESIKLTQQKNFNVNQLILPKFLKFKENLQFVPHIIFLAIKCLVTGILLYVKNPLRSKILLTATSSFFTRKTYSNYLLRQRLREFYGKESVNALYLTFEGHSYEQMLTNDALQCNKRISIYLYQHSPIVPYHFGIRNHLNNLDSNTFVLTTGIFYKKYLQSISSKPNYIIFGSNKARHNKSQASIKCSSIIYVPEGTFSATLDMLKLIHQLIRRLPDYAHVLRTHPDLKPGIGMKLLLKVLSKSSNFRLSKSDLSGDLISSEYLVYRSSAAGIESLVYNVKPIFFAKPIYSGLNVLFMDKNLYYEAVNEKDVVSLIKSNSTKIILDNNKNKFSELFTSLDFEALLGINLE